jgi:hypothetical protein
MKIILIYMIFIVAVFSTVAAAQWPENGLCICSFRGDQSRPQIVQSSDGCVIVVWVDNRGSNRAIYAQRLDAFGNALWAAGGIRVASREGSNFSSPSVAPDGYGGAYIAWQSELSGYIDIYAHRIGRDGYPVWVAPSGVPVCTAAGSQIKPRLLGLGTSGAMIVWVDRRTGENDIYAQYLSPTTGACRWAANGISVCRAAGNQYEPRIASDGDGGAIVAWFDGRLERNTIYAQRIRPTGLMMWDADGLGICGTLRNKVAPDIAPDGLGGAVFVWSDMSAGKGDIYAQKVDGAGNKVWDKEGVQVCTEMGAQTMPRAVTDQQGGAFVCWQDARDESMDIYAQRIDASGASAWLDGGIPISVGPENEYMPRIARCESRGAIIAWLDDRSRIDNIRVEAVDMNGGILWYKTAMLPNTVSSPRSNPFILSLGAGGVFVAWEERGIRDRDIYVKGMMEPVTARCAIAAVDAAVPASAAKLFPNPFNPTLTISYMIEGRAWVAIDIFDGAGRCIRSLVRGEQQTGEMTAVWDGADERGSRVASGVYFCRLSIGSRIESRKVVLMR